MQSRQERWNEAWRGTLYPPVVNLTLTEEEEDLMLCWIKLNPFLYVETVSHVQLQARCRAWRDQGKVMGYEGTDLKAWFTRTVHEYYSLRIRQKLEVSASFRGRDAWLLANWNFLQSLQEGQVRQVLPRPKMPVLRVGSGPGSKPL
jgi:hypothetical protein